MERAFYTLAGRRPPRWPAALAASQRLQTHLTVLQAPCFAALQSHMVDGRNA